MMTVHFYSPTFFGVAKIIEDFLASPESRIPHLSYEKITVRVKTVWRKVEKISIERINHRPGFLIEITYSTSTDIHHA